MNNRDNSSKGKVLLTTDFSEPSLQALPYALDAAQARGTKLTILNLFEEVTIPTMFGEYLPSPYFMEETRAARLQAAEQTLAEITAARLAGIDAIGHVLPQGGAVADTIVKYAVSNDIGLIVMASHGRGLVGRITIGSVTERVLRHSPCPLLIVPCVESLEVIQTPDLPYHHILITTDFSPESEGAFPIAMFEAQRCNSRVTLIHVIESLFAPELLQTKSTVSPTETTEIEASYHRGVQQRLAQMASAHTSEIVIKSTLVDKTYSIANSITEFARSSRADLIVIATRGAGSRLHWLGSVAERVIRQSPCPVLAVPKGEERILAASENSSVRPLASGA